ncbi:hypothetical protein CN173_17160 [Sinorhizobium meliloti]|nr:hypothetical protein CN173_17160 [Sinorhizobium meliloti]
MRALAAIHSGTTRGMAWRIPLRCRRIPATKRDACPGGGITAAVAVVCLAASHCRTSGSSNNSMSCWTLAGGACVAAS